MPPMHDSSHALPAGYKKNDHIYLNDIYIYIYIFSFEKEAAHAAGGDDFFTEHI